MKKLIGTVVSDKMAKTRIVAVVRTKTHSRYHKQYKATTRFKAHDEENAYKMGDVVMIQEVRPMSKEKRWVIVGKTGKQS